jgi:hypothetical protein
MTRPMNRGLPQPLPPPSAQLALAFINSSKLHRAIYVIAMASVFAVVGIWLSVSARRQARREGTARPRGAFGGILLGAFGLALSLLGALAFALFWHQLMTYSTCLGQANSVAATQACQDQFTNTINSRISVLQSGR